MRKSLIVLLLLVLTFALCACHQHGWQDATCIMPKTCTECGETEGEATGHIWSVATCETPKTCSACGETKGEPNGHIWEDATCVVPKTCSVCGITEGVADGAHSWTEATCTQPKTCAICGATEGSTRDHNWVNATCSTPKTCSACGKEEGSAAGHKWESATCSKPKTCAVCGVTEGSVVNHNWLKATCTKPQTCSMCGKTEGTTISHSWVNATCVAPKTCSVCGKTEGAANGHVWETVNIYTKVCKTCGSKEIDQSKTPVSLGTLNPCTGKNYYTELNYTKQDIYGNKFSKGLNIRFYRYAFQSTWSPSTCSSEYALNGEYKKFTATILIDCDSDDTFEGDLKIYVDGVLKFDSNAMNKKTKAINLEIDISNAVFLKIEASRISVHGTIMLADPTLHH